VSPGAEPGPDSGRDADSTIGTRPAPGRPPKPVHRFVLQAAVALALLGWATSDSSLYPRLIHLQGDALFGWVGSGRWLEFDWVDPQSRRDRSDTRLLGMANVDGTPERRWRAVFSVRRRGLWPLATWVALLLATPMTLRQRLGRLAVGVVVLDGFLMAQIAWIAICSFGATAGGAGAADWTAAVRISTALFNSPVPTYALLFALWVWLANPSEAIAWKNAIAWLRRVLGVDRTDRV